jgi:hypothetical protein
VHGRFLFGDDDRVGLRIRRQMLAHQDAENGAAAAG